MDLAFLLAYGICNIAMIAYYLFSGKSRYFEFPFWFGAIGLGWFYPQAIGGYHGIDLLPDGYFQKGMMFATLCTVAMWLGYVQSTHRNRAHSGTLWLMERYDPTRLYYACTGLCVMGFFFFFKLQMLPEELKASSQWTGAPVMYLFLSGMFKIGFIGLFIMYLHERKIFSVRFALLVPCFVMLILPVLLGGRRADMMSFIGYTLFPLWFVRRLAIPRIWITTGLVLGIILINAIHLYRSAMKDSSELALGERLNIAAKQDYLKENKSMLDKPGFEFEKYIYRMAGVEKLKAYDFGMSHWNELVFNYVPAQWVGRTLKQSLMFDHISPYEAGRRVFNFSGAAGATHTGYMDAFASFGYFGFIKFWIIGLMMGTLYQKAMEGYFLPQLLFALGLNSAMHSISHATNEILIRIWIYFFIFGFLPFYYSRKNRYENVHAVEGLERI